MNIRNQGVSYPRLRSSSLCSGDFPLPFRGRRDTNQFRSGLDATDGLLYGGEGVHRIGGGHGLHPDGWLLPISRLPILTSRVLRRLYVVRDSQ